MHEVHASDVLNDPIRDLALAVRGLLIGDAERSVHFWEEEPTTILHLIVDTRREELTLRLYETKETEREEVRGTLLGIEQLPFREGCRRLVRILENIDVPEFLEVHEREWEREFPREKIRECRDLL